MEASVGKESTESSRSGYENLDGSCGSNYNVVFPCNDHLNDPAFVALVQQAQEAIEVGHCPQLIRKGTSGSYYVTNKDLVSLLRTL